MGVADETVGSAPGSPPPTSPSFTRWYPWTDPQRRRLCEKLVELDVDVHRVPSSMADGVAAAHEYLRRAHAAAAARDLNAGWTLVGRIDECLIMALNPAQIRARACELQREVVDGGKLGAWRREAVLELLEPLVGQILPETETAQARLAAAVGIRNEAFTNDYRRMALQRRHLWVLLVSGTLVLGGAVAMLAIHAGRIGVEGSATSSWVLFTALLLGASGAITSAAQRATQYQKRTRIPGHIESYMAALSRLPIGAVAALTVWLAFRAGTAADAVVGPLFVAAFGAGFTERLVTGDRVSDPAAQRSSPPPAG